MKKYLFLIFVVFFSSPLQAEQSFEAPKVLENWEELIKKYNVRSPLLEGNPANLFGCKGKNAKLVQKNFYDDPLIKRFTRSVAQEYWEVNIFAQPHGIMVMPTSAGRIIFVCDPIWSRIVWTVEGSIDLPAFGTRGNGPGQFRSPCDIAGKSPNIFIADYSTHRVSHYKVWIDSVSFLGIWTKYVKAITFIKDIGEGTLEWPFGIDYSDNGTPDNIGDDLIYVADSYKQNIYKFDIDGNFVSSFGNGKFVGPSDIAVGKKDGTNTKDIFVIDNSWSKKGVFAYCDTTGSSLAHYPLGIDCDLTSIATDCYGCPYVSDATNNKIIKLKPDLTDTAWTYGTGFNEIHDVYIFNDELFVTEKWTNNSGISYYWLELEDIPPDIIPPIAEIISPVDTPCVACSIEIIGTVTDNESYIKYWKLSYGKGDEPTDTILVDFGTGSKVNEVLTVWNTSDIMQRGLYTVILEAVDGAGNKAYDTAKIWITIPWQVRITARSDFCCDTLNYAGTDCGASDNFDQGYDKPEPIIPSPSPYLQLYFPHPEWNHLLGPKFCVDLRGLTCNAREVFDFEIITDQPNKSITISTIPIDVDTGQDIYLLDIRNNLAQNMRVNNQYIFVSDTSETYNFQLIVGQCRRKVQNWALISIPVIPNNSNTATIFKDCVEQYWLYGYRNSYIIPRTIKNGYGYWLGVADTTTLDVGGIAPPDIVSVSLNKGWNIVGDPFYEPIGFYDMMIAIGGDTLDMGIAVDSGLVQPILYDYISETGYDESKFLHSWRGCWFATLADSLKLIMKKTQEGTKGTDYETKLLHSTDEWRLTINALFKHTQGTASPIIRVEPTSIGNIVSDNITALGTSPEASDGFNAKQDFFEPPVCPVDEQISVYFLRNDWKPEIGNKFNRDIRSPMKDKEIKVWNFEIATTNSTIDRTKDSEKYNLTSMSRTIIKLAVETKEQTLVNQVTKLRAVKEKSSNLFIPSEKMNGQVVLSWPTIKDMPKELSFVLLDKEMDKQISMENNESYTYTIPQNNHCNSYKFEIEVTYNSQTTDTELPRYVWAFHQNRPNPFVRNTVIRYSVAAKSHVALKVYDICGRLVKTLVNTDTKPGYYSVKWDSKDITSGIYFLKFESDRFNAMRKAIIIR